MLRLIILLRLAVLLNRTRSPVKIPSIDLVAGERGLAIGFPQQWFDKNPLTEADLARESSWLELIGFDLVLSNRQVLDADVG